MWKMKICIILVKNGCAIVLKRRQAKLKEMTDGQFASKDEVAQADILLAWEDKILSNVNTTYTTNKELSDSLSRVYEDKSLINKIYQR